MALLLREGAVQEPGDDGEVLALVEGGQNHRVQVLAGRLLCGGHVGRIGKRKSIRKEIDSMRVENKRIPRGTVWRKERVARKRDPGVGLAQAFLDGA